MASSEDTRQTILTVNKFMEYLTDEVELSDTDKVWVYFLKDHALKSNLSKKFLGDRDEEEVCFHPIKILIRHEGGKLEAVKVEDLQEEFGEDFGMRFKITKRRTLTDEHEINMLEILAKKQHFKDITYYPSSVGIYKAQIPFLDKMLEKNTSKPFTFRKVQKKHTEETDLDDIMKFIN